MDGLSSYESRKEGYKGNMPREKALVDDQL